MKNTHFKAYLNMMEVPPLKNTRDQLSISC